MARFALPEGFSWNDPFREIFRDVYGPAWEPNRGLLAEAVMEQFYPGGSSGLSLDIRDTVDRKKAAKRGLLHTPLVTKNAGTYAGREDQIILDPKIREKNLAEWFRDSTVTRGSNPAYTGAAPSSPKSVWHGTKPEQGVNTPYDDEGQLFDVFDVTKSDTLGQHFGTLGAAQQFTGVSERWEADPEYDEMGEQKPLYRMRRHDPSLEAEAPGGSTMGPFALRLENPLLLPDMGHWEPQEVLAQLLRQEVITDQEYQRTLPDMHYFIQMPKDESSKAKRIKANQILRELIESKGYDGVEYYNTVEVSKDVRGNKLQDVGPYGPRHRKEKSYIIFHPNQVKQVNTNRGYFRPDRDSFMTKIGNQPTGLFGA